MGSSPQSEQICDDDSYTEFHQGKIAFTEKLISCSNQYTKQITKIAPEKSVLLCVRAPVGELNISDRELCIGRGLSAITPICNISELFLFYLLQPLKQVLNDKATGSTFVAVTADVVKSLLVPVPPLEEQERILKLLEKSFQTFSTITDLEK